LSFLFLQDKFKPYKLSSSRVNINKKITIKNNHEVQQKHFLKLLTVEIFMYKFAHSD